MASVKLTNYARDAIRDRAVKESFREREEQFAKVEDALAREAFAVVIPAADLALAQTLPDNWLRKDECLRFNVGGQDITLGVLGGGLPVPYTPYNSDDSGYYCHRLGVIPHGDLCDRIQSHAAAKEKLREERRAARQAVSQLLSKVTTIGKLKEVWPEGQPFYADYEEKPPVQLPAVRADEVNALLGINNAPA